MVESYKMERAKVVKPASVNRELALLKTMFNKAIFWGMMNESPMKQVKLFKENNARVRYLDTEEIAKLLRNCSESHYYGCHQYGYAKGGDSEP